MSDSTFKTLRPRFEARRQSFSPGKFLGLGFLSFLCITLFYFAYSSVIVPMGSALRDRTVPLMRAANNISYEVGAFFEHVYHLVDLSHENRSLKREQQEQNKWQVLAQHLKSENMALREMLNVVPEGDRAFLTSRVVSYPDHSAAKQQLLIRGGLQDGFEAGNLVFFGKYAVGRLVGVGRNTSTVLLFKDGASKIPVKNLHGARGLLKGNVSSQFMRLAYVNAAQKINVGDAIVTSADGDIVDAGYTLGTVAAIHDDVIDVKAPYSDARAMTYVQVMVPPAAQ